MTDTRIPDRWMQQGRFRRLTDRQFRSYFVALVWTVSERTEGVVRPEDVGLIVDFDAEAIPVFLESRLWRKVRSGWLIVDFDETQTTRAELDAIDVRRAADRERKKVERAAAREAKLAASTSADGDVHSDVQGTSTRTSDGLSGTLSDTSPHAVPKAKDQDKAQGRGSTTPEPFSKNGSARSEVLKTSGAQSKKLTPAEVLRSVAAATAANVVNGHER